MVSDMPHLIDEAHRTRITIQKLEVNLSCQPRFIECRYELCAAIDNLAPTFIQSSQIGTRFRRPHRPGFSFRRPPRESDPVFICPALVATARSAMNESSVSPERCEITAVLPFDFANAMQSSVSVSVPI